MCDDGGGHSAEKNSGLIEKQSRMDGDQGGQVSEDNRDGRASNGAQDKVEEDGRDSDSEIVVLGVVSRDNSGEDSTGGLVQERIKEVEQRDYSVVTEEVWNDAIKPLEIARCKGYHTCLLCVLLENEKMTCPFRRDKTAINHVVLSCVSGVDCVGVNFRCLEGASHCVRATASDQGNGAGRMDYLQFGYYTWQDLP
eukprot:1179980-Rhodomonas_salina.1